jgi:hypothetical protein
VTVNCCGEFGLTLSGNAGVVVEPVGNPAIATETALVNPLTAVTDTVTGVLVAPCITLRLVVDAETLKSGAGAGVFEPPPPPPQATISAVHERVAAT